MNLIIKNFIYEKINKLVWKLRNRLMRGVYYNLFDVHNLNYNHTFTSAVI